MDYGVHHESITRNASGTNGFLHVSITSPSRHGKSESITSTSRPAAYYVSSSSGSNPIAFAVRRSPTR